MVSTVSLINVDWIANQSCSRLAAFLMALHRPVAAGAASADFNGSDMALFRGGQKPLSDRYREKNLEDRLAPHWSLIQTWEFQPPPRHETIDPYVRHRTASAARKANNPDSCVVDCFSHAIRTSDPKKGNIMNNIVWLVGAIVIIIAVLSFFGLR